MRVVMGGRGAGEMPQEPPGRDRNVPGGWSQGLDSNQRYTVLQTVALTSLATLGSIAKDTQAGGGRTPPRSASARPSGGRARRGPTHPGNGGCRAQAVTSSATGFSTGTPTELPHSLHEPS